MELPEEDRRKQSEREALATALVETLQAAMLMRYGKPIEVMLKNDGNGLKPYFRFVKLGLMPTALEKEYFDGVAEGFRAALGALLARPTDMPAVASNG